MFYLNTVKHSLKAAGSPPPEPRQENIMQKTRIEWLSAEGETPNLVAARRKFSSCPTATKPTSLEKAPGLMIAESRSSSHADYVGLSREIGRTIFLRSIEGKQS
jgi:hypothetical protein